MLGFDENLMKFIVKNDDAQVVLVVPNIMSTVTANLLTAVSWLSGINFVQCLLPEI